MKLIRILTVFQLAYAIVALVIFTVVFTRLPSTIPELDQKGSPAELRVRADSLVETYVRSHHEFIYGLAQDWWGMTREADAIGDPKREADVWNGYLSYTCASGLRHLDSGFVDQSIVDAFFEKGGSILEPPFDVVVIESGRMWEIYDANAVFSLYSFEGNHLFGSRIMTMDEKVSKFNRKMMAGLIEMRHISFLLMFAFAVIAFGALVNLIRFNSVIGLIMMLLASIIPNPVIMHVLFDIPSGEQFYWMMPCLVLLAIMIIAKLSSMWKEWTKRIKSGDVSKAELFLYRGLIILFVFTFAGGSIGVSIGLAMEDPKYMARLIGHLIGPIIAAVIIGLMGSGAYAIRQLRKKK